MRPTRRRTVLEALAGLAGLVGLAGCGYRPAGGEFRWRVGAFYHVDRLVPDGDTLLLVTREAMTFDFDTDQWSEGGYVVSLDSTRGERTGEYGFATPALTAALGADAVYAGLADGVVTAVPVEEEDVSGDPERSDTDTPTPESGEWTTSTDVASSGVVALAVGDGSTAYAGGNGGLAALSRDGRVRWRWRDGSVTAAVQGEGGTAVYVLTPDRLVAFAGDGSVRWSRDVTPTDTGEGRPIPPLVDGSGVYLADDDGLVALAHDGSVRWERDVAEPAGRPALTADGLYHASANTVRALSFDGRERWAHEPDDVIGSRVAAADGRAFVLAGTDLVGVGAEGTAWRIPLDEPEPFTPEFGPFAVGETLVLGDPGEVRGYWRSQLRR